MTRTSNPLFKRSYIPSSTLENQRQPSSVSVIFNLLFRTPVTAIDRLGTEAQSARSDLTAEKPVTKHEGATNKPDRFATAVCASYQ